MSAHSERRRASRVRTRLSGRLVTAEGVALAIEVDGLSVVGLHGRTREPIGLGTTGRIEILAGNQGVEVRGTVVRSSQRELAIRFDYVPFESFGILKAFLLLHAEDPAVLADELDERLGFLEESA